MRLRKKESLINDKGHNLQIVALGGLTLLEEGMSVPYVPAEHSLNNTCYMPLLAEAKPESDSSLRSSYTKMEDSEDHTVPRPTSEAVSDTRLHSFYLLSGVWQNEAECNPKTRTWAAAQHSRGWHFINAVHQNPPCSLMTPFSEKEAQCWPERLCLWHTGCLQSFSDMASSRQSIDPGDLQDRALLYSTTHVLHLYSRTERKFPASLILHQINSEIPWRQARHGLGSLKMLMEAE